MMIRYLACILLLFISMGISVYGQQKTVCGVTAEDSEIILRRLMLNKIAIKNGILAKRKNNNNNITYVPVTFHLAAKNDGSQRIREKLVLDVLCDMNEDFLPANIQFFMNNSTFSYQNNDAIFSVTGSSETGVMQFAKDPNAVNIWVVGEIPQSGNSPGQTAGFYNTQLDWIVINKSEINGNDFALTHELGHFFSLPHTFLGWESDPYDPTKHGNPVQATAPDGRPTELVDRSNCETTGDRICDTPPDYNFGLLDRECIYDGGAQDPNGVLVDPDDSNFLTWNGDCDRSDYTFTQTQLDLIQANLLNDNNFFFPTGSRRYLRNNSTPPVTERVTEQATIIGPANGADVPAAATITLEWEAPANASHALIELSIVPTFSLQPIRLNVEGNSVEIPLELLSIDRRFYWRILPYNALGSCETFSGTRSFTVRETTSTTVEIPEVEEISVLPNPVPANQEVLLLTEASERFTAQLNLVDLNGAIVRSLNSISFLAGTTTTAISTDGLNPGIYVIVLQSEKGITSRRLVVL